MKNYILKSLKEYSVNIFKIINDNNNEKFINKYLDNIYVINLKDNLIRRNYIIILMKKYGINFNLIVVDRLNEETYKNIKTINENLSKEEI